MNITALNQRLTFISSDENVDKRPDLPKEILSVIFFSYAELEPSTNTLSRDWYAKSLQETKSRLYNSLNHFLKLLIGHLKEPYSSQMQSKELVVGVLNAIDFMRLQASLFTSREAVLNILKEVESEELQELKTSLENEDKPKFFEELFDLVDIYKDIKVFLSDDEGRNALRLSWILTSFKDLRGSWTSHRMNKVLDMIQPIPNELKLITLRIIKPELKTKALRNRALTLARTIETSEISSIQREEASKFIAESEDV